MPQEQPRSPLAAEVELRANWISITLTLVSIVEGMAFSFLASQLLNLPVPKATLPTVSYYQLGSLEWMIALVDVLPTWLAAAFCFILVLRILQTYITAVLDYQKTLDMAEFVVMFVIGALQYVLIHAVFMPQPSIPGRPVYALSHLSFGVSGAIIALLAVIGYSLTLSKIVAEQRAHSSIQAASFSAEVGLQLKNLAGVATVLLGSLTVALSTQALWVSLVLILMSVAMGLNIANSITATFNRRKPEPLSLDVHPLAPRAGVGNAAPVVLTVRQARPADASTIAGLLESGFDYLFSKHLFQCTPAESIAILERSLHYLDRVGAAGVQAFHVYESNGVPVGCACTSIVPARRYVSILSLLCICAARLLTNPGTLHRSGVARMRSFIKATIEALHLDAHSYPRDSRQAIHIDYIIVSSSSRGRGVGIGILRDIVERAGSQNSCITAAVRSRNNASRRMFLRCGFSERGARPEPIDQIRAAQGSLILYGLDQ